MVDQEIPLRSLGDKASLRPATPQKLRAGGSERVPSRDNKGLGQVSTQPVELNKDLLAGTTHDYDAGDSYLGESMGCLV